jgi:hypothetical protein
MKYDTKKMINRHIKAKYITVLEDILKKQS